MSKKPRKKKQMRTTPARPAYSDEWMDRLETHLAAADTAYAAVREQQSEAARLQAEVEDDPAAFVAAVAKLERLVDEQVAHARAALDIRPDVA